MKQSQIPDPPPKILALHDLSAFGHTSLLAVIPIYNRLGIRACAFPTAVLSANTDYPDVRWVNLSQHLEGFVRHWQDLGLKFAAIHTGFLASPEQAVQVGSAIAALRDENTTVLVDPVMGDNGKLYKCFGPDIVAAMRDLIGKADIITPNCTEAALLAGADPAISPAEPLLKDWCRSLGNTGPRHVIVTSVQEPDQNVVQVYYYNTIADYLCSFPYLSDGQPHPGAGDCFAALVVAGITLGCSVAGSVQAAVEIMTRAIGLGVPSGADWREGIALEQVLQWDLSAFYSFPPE